MTAFRGTADGEWIAPIRRGYKVACCDCGLVHSLDIKVIAGRVLFRARRDAAATRARRGSAPKLVMMAARQTRER